MKKIFKGSVITLLFVVQFTMSMAQITDTVFVLPEYSVKEKRMHYFNAGSMTQRIDPVVIENNSAASLSDLLINNSTLHIDAYGAGQTVISARGLGAKRTPVIWNGFNLQSISGHDVDVSLIQAFMIDNIQIETGSSSALYGSGAAGGVVYIDNNQKISSPNQTLVGISVGSYGRYMGGSSVRWGNSSYKGNIRLFYNAADNDFHYTADYYNTKTKKTTAIDTNQVNAAKHQFGLMSDNLIQINAHQSLKLHFWFQDNNRQIAPTLKDVAARATTDAVQVDQDYRGSAEWDIRHKAWSSAVRSAILINHTDYDKPVSNSHTKTDGSSWITEAEATWLPFEMLSLNMGLHYTYEQGESSSYEEAYSRNRGAVFASARFNNTPTKTQVTLNGRLEHIEMTDFPLTWTIGLNQAIWKHLSLIAKAGTSYRVPSFNDLYWDSSTMKGNPDLKPEEGYNAECGLQWKSTHDKLSIEAGSSLFYMEMKNWMSWGTNDEGIYTVLNQDSARIKGVEAQAALTYGTEKHNIGIRGAYSYLDAKDPKNDNYLVYVPMHKGTVSVSGTINGFQLMASRTQSHKMAAKTDNSIYIDGYSIYDCGLNKEIELSTMSINIGLKLQNITDEQYQTRQNYPMMGRQYLVTTIFKL